MAELTLERTFAADAELVFAHLTRTDLLLKWWGPEGIHVTEHNLDLSKPGPWSSVMTNAEGTNYKVTGEVVAVDPPRSVEFTWAWHDDNDERGHESRVRFSVEPLGDGKARFTLFHTGLPDDEVRDSHVGGWTSALVKLERVFA